MSGAGVIDQGFGQSAASVIAEGFAAYTGLPDPPASGYQYTDQTSIFSGGPGTYSFQQGSVPPVQIGDVVIDSIASSPSGYLNTVNGDGTVVLFAGGDASRQELNYAIYRVLGNAIDPSNFPTGFAKAWINEVAPVWYGVPTFPFGLAVSQAMTPINLAGFPYASSPEGDVLTFTLASGTMPPGLSLSGAGVISGTPTTLGTYLFTVNATDSTNAPQGTTASPQIMMPVVLAGFLTILQAVETLSAANCPVNPVYIYAYSSTVPDGYVISINPPSGTPISPGSTVQLTVSLGPPNPLITTNIPNVVGKHIIFAEQALLAAECCVGTVTWQLSNSVAPSYVISQSPVAGGPLSPWQSVNLVVSSGPLQNYPNTGMPVVPPMP
jgi:hypothetical protein